jgi:hypothetical protein
MCSRFCCMANNNFPILVTGWETFWSLLNVTDALAEAWTMQPAAYLLCVIHSCIKYLTRLLDPQMQKKELRAVCELHDLVRPFEELPASSQCSKKSFIINNINTLYILNLIICAVCELWLVYDTVKFWIRQNICKMVLNCISSDVSRYQI